MINVHKSVNADSRTSSPNSGIDNLKYDTESHIRDVGEGLNFMADLLKAKGPEHDHTKIENMEEFYSALKSGHIKDTNWYRNHITKERHHLLSNVPQDVNLLDVIEHLVDCTMAGLTRSGTIYDVDLPAELLQLAVSNTVELLKKNVNVVEDHDILNDEIDGIE